MPEVPRIVHHRLRTAAPETPGQTHPEADVLTAFAEQALPAPERDGVLQHLALCADCRDVVALALPEVHAAIPPMEEETAVAVPRAVIGRTERRFSWASPSSWAHLRWATLAAGIAVAVFVVRPGLERLGQPHTTANQVSLPAAQPQSAAAAQNGKFRGGRCRRSGRGDAFRGKTTGERST